MAREKSGWDRFRDREKEREEEERSKLKKETESVRLPGAAPSSQSPKSGNQQQGTDYILVELIQKAESLMEQIQGLYNMYVAGMERTPPVTHRKHLEDIAFKIQNAAKTSAGLKFRAQQFHAKYQTYKDKWDRLMKDIESGKVIIKRKS